MRFGIGLIMVVVGLVAGFSSSAEPMGDPISGDWNVTFEIQGMTTPATFHLELRGDLLGGTAESHHTGPGKVREGSWKDNRLALTLDFDSHESIAVTGELRNGELAGEFRTEGMQGKWKAKKRQPGEPVRAAHGESDLPRPFGPYEFLIGEWDVAPEGGSPASAVQRVRWGPNHSYIWYAASLITNGKEEPHFEGLLLWNGVHKNLDMLLILDLKYGLAQEQGTLSVEPDGTVVRDITAVYSEGVSPLGGPRIGPAGGTGHFRQTFKPLGPDRISTAVMRETEQGWAATFPGSDHLVMTRRKG